MLIKMKMAVPTDGYDNSCGDGAAGGAVFVCC